jgi:hypothetical protein
MSVPPQAIAPNPHTNLLNCKLQIKWGFSNNKIVAYVFVTAVKPRCLATDTQTEGRAL